MCLKCPCDNQLLFRKAPLKSAYLKDALKDYILLLVYYYYYYYYYYLFISHRSAYVSSQLYNITTQIMCNGEDEKE